MSLERRARFLFLALAAATAGAAAAACPARLQFLGANCEQWQAQVLPQSLPAARGNAFADNEAAANLGMRVFYDNRFSKSGSGVACVNCHVPESAFAERKPVSRTIRQVVRNAPDLINAAWYTRAHFWDGKVDSLWSAPLFTFEQEDEMGANRLGVVRTLATIYKARYEKIFGAMPDLTDTTRFPLSGKPGTAEYDAMAAPDRDAVDRVYANLGKSLEAYIRKLAAGRAPFDDFMSGSIASPGADAQRGMLAFTRLACGACHSGPTFTDEGFHDLAGAEKAAQPKDAARAGGLRVAASWQFSATSRYADPASAATIASNVASAEDPTGFRTPTLRNVEFTYPYGHDGSFATLEQAIEAHAKVLPGNAAPDAADLHDLVAFLHSLSGRPPQRPWNYWPGG